MLAEIPDLQVVDVRNPAEQERGALPGARLIPLPTLLDQVDTLDPSRTTVVYCAGGYRSSIAASLLRSHGFAAVGDLLGGFDAWHGAGLPTAPGAPGRGAVTARRT
jgi:rhodanese-related sulfurtransferase